MFHGSTGRDAKGVITNPEPNDPAHDFGTLFYTFEGVKTGIHALSFALDKPSMCYQTDNPIIAWYIVHNSDIKSTLNADKDGNGSSCARNLSILEVTPTFGLLQ